MEIRINFLRQKNRRKKILHLFSEVIIVVSAFLLIFPFYGTIDYHLAQSAQSIPKKISVAPSQNIKTKNLTTIFQEIKKAAEIYAQAQNVQKAKSTPASSKTISTNLVLDTKTAPVQKTVQQKPKQNMLYIPKIKVEINIVEGKNENALFSGAWRIPGTSTPDAGGNTVIGGHRWQFKPPSTRTFYNLDKVAVGDEIQVLWERKKYAYKIREIKIIKPEQIEILENTEDNILTLFTCTPLFSTKNRLVVIAEKI
ncbi:MAG: hypothetical protein US74_C0023G0029 [Parcubacteria group bacterium GW2011_GWA2_38_13]|nr:MAG: hypothetical protein US74_C0023G0029 [Parcubacteria group bacterium GW2011_GWA2_38_13]